MAKIEAVRSAILFGSTARGSATEESDIDLFIECDRKRERELSRRSDLGSQFDATSTPILGYG